LSFESFRDSLKDEDQQLLSAIFREENNKKQNLIREEIESDRRHLEIINFCSNLFTPGLELDSLTGYRLMLIEPLCSIGIRNFDLGVFNDKSRCLLLVECKHSISRIKPEIVELSKAIEETNGRKIELEDILGGSINYIEYVLCIPAMEVSEVLREVSTQSIPLCVWGFDLMKRELRLFCETSDSEHEIKSGRMHRDGNLSRILFRGITSKTLVRSIPIIPSSHMCTLLIHVTAHLYLERVIQGTENIFSYPDVYNLILNQFERHTYIPEEYLKGLTTRIIETALRKDIMEDYIIRNAFRLAEVSAIARFKKESGFTDLSPYLK